MLANEKIAEAFALTFRTDISDNGADNRQEKFASLLSDLNDEEKKELFSFHLTAGKQREVFPGLKEEEYFPDHGPLLHWMAKRGEFNLIHDCITKWGADVNIKDNANGDTALMIVSRLGRPARMIGLGSKLDLQNNTAETALICAVRRKHSSAACELLRAGANYELKNTEGKTALQYAEELDGQMYKEMKVITDLPVVSASQIKA